MRGGWLPFPFLKCFPGIVRVAQQDALLVEEIQKCQNLLPSGGFASNDLHACSTSLELTGDTSKELI